MKKAVLKLSGRTVESIFVLGKGVAEAMTGNLSYPSPPVTPDALRTASEALEEAHINASETRSIVDYTIQRAKKVIVCDMLKQLCDYVNSIAMGNEELIRSAGMPVSKTRSKQPAPAMVRDFIAEFTGIPQSIMLRWKRPHYASMFRVYMTLTPDNDASWELIDTVRVRKLMVSNLASGKRFYFKVVAVGTAGVSPDSEIAEAIAS